jgi:hypothetical protein
MVPSSEILIGILAVSKQNIKIQKEMASNECDMTEAELLVSMQRSS